LPCGTSPGSAIERDIQPKLASSCGSPSPACAASSRPTSPPPAISLICYTA